MLAVLLRDDLTNGRCVGSHRLAAGRQGLDLQGLREGRQTACAQAATRG